MYNFSISEVLDQAWALTKKHGLLLALILFVISLVESAFTNWVDPTQINALVENLDTNDPNAFISAYSSMLQNVAFSPYILMGSLLTLVLNCAVRAIMLSLAKGTTSDISIEPVKMPVMAYVKYIAWEILYGIIVCIGLCLCIVPGLWIGARLATVQFYFLDNPEIGFGEAIRRGWESTDGHALNLIGLGIVCFFIVMAGLLLCCIGIYFTEVIAHFSLIVVYLILSGFYSQPSVADNLNDDVETI